eukprot:1151252-Pelagomonas_calceolata.AAC.1
MSWLQEVSGMVAGMGVELLGDWVLLDWVDRVESRSSLATWIVFACWVARWGEKEYVGCVFLKYQDCWAEY